MLLPVQGTQVDKKSAHACPQTQPLNCHANKLNGLVCSKIYVHSVERATNVNLAIKHKENTDIYTKEAEADRWTQVNTILLGTDDPF
jgi:hypothetical protein